MAKQTNLPMLVAQHGDKAGYVLASVLALVFVILMIRGPEQGDMTLAQFQDRVRDLRTTIQADDDAQPTRLEVAEDIRNQLPERHSDDVRATPLPRDLVVAPRPGLEMRVQLEGQKGAPAHGLELLEAVNQEIHLRWRPSQHSDTAAYSVTVWEMDDEGWSSPPSRPRPTSTGEGEHNVSQVSSPGDPDTWVEYTIVGVTDNTRYGVLVHSVDGQGNRVSYRGNPEGQQSEDNFEQHQIERLRDRGLYIEATPAGRRLGVPEPINPTVQSQSLAGIRLQWTDPRPSEDTVDLDAVRVQIWRWEAENPTTTRTLLTPSSPQRPTGWALFHLNGQFVDREIQPETEFVYAIRFYHVGEAYPPLNRTGRARTAGVSLSEGEEHGEVRGEIAYAGEVIVIDYPQRDRRGDYDTDRGTGEVTLLEDETYVFATEMIEFETSRLEEDRVFLYNRPLIEVISINPGDPQFGRSPHIGGAEVHITLYFEVSDPETGEATWERFGATFYPERQLGDVETIGERTRPETAGAHRESIDDYEGGRWRNAVGELDFSTSLIVIGFYSINYRAGYELEYVEFYDIESDRWPFKVYPQYIIERYPELAEYQAEHDFGRAPDQTLALYSRYKQEIEYPARRRVVASQNAEHFVFDDMDGRLRDWMFEWGYDRRLDWAREQGHDTEAAGEPPMWEFSVREGIRFFPRSFLNERRRRDSLDPEIVAHDTSTWHNEVRRIQAWARGELTERFEPMLADLEDTVTEEMRQFVLTPGYNEAALPLIVEFIRNNPQREVNLELAELIFDALREHHGIDLGHVPAGTQRVQERIDELQQLLTDLYGELD